jgi:hypothetical protein
MQRFLSVVALALFTPLVALGAPSGPVVNNGSINYQTNQVTLSGSSFQPGKTAPTVLFNGSSLALSSFSDTQIIATLPAGLLPGTFNLTVNSSSGSTTFDLTYGATGPQGSAGPAGPTGSQGPIGPVGPAGSQGPRGITGAPGAPGPAGANGVGFNFLNAFGPYATYAENDVVTYNGSSYVAIVPNGPNPYGPTPDKNPSWSVMAAVGATGATGPAGPQGSIGDPGPQGLMGNPGPIGPAGPVGPQGPAGGVLSFVTNKSSAGLFELTQSALRTVNSIVLPNIGVYVLGGVQTILNNSSFGEKVTCYVGDEGAFNDPAFNATYSGGSLDTNLMVAIGYVEPNGSYVTLPLNLFYSATKAPTTIVVNCIYQGYQGIDGAVFNGDGSITAIQVK